jgi:hypothetical protein
MIAQLQGSNVIVSFFRSAGVMKYSTGTERLGMTGLCHVNIQDSMLGLAGNNCLM